MYDITEDYGLPHPGEGPFYTDYLRNVVEELPNTSLGAVNWNENLYPHLAAHKDRLVDRFNREYAFREIGQETVTRWMHFLQCRFDEVAEHYDHMYKIYEENNIDELGTGYSYTEHMGQNKTNHSTGSGSSSADSKYSDTPNGANGAINNPTTQNVDTGSSTSTVDGSDTNEYNKEIKRIDHEEHMVDELNALVDKYVSTDNEFIAEFENMFIGVY